MVPPSEKGKCLPSTQIIPDKKAPQWNDNKQFLGRTKYSFRYRSYSEKAYVQRALITLIIYVVCSTRL